MARILVLTFFLVLLTIIKANSIDNLSFTFKKFKPNQPNLIFQGNAVATSSGKLQLTNEDRWSLGRVLYTTPIQIWDKETGNAASFTSSFSITINVSQSMNPSDGFAFFLAPIDSQPQTYGGSLGIYNGDGYNTLLQTVAVEFDTYENSWDPKGQHIGINVNNARSIKTLPWSLVSDKVAKIRVTYDASTSLLAASLIYPSEKTSYILSEKVDLKSILPEWVRIGFSATTGGSSSYTETHEVLSWSFSSGEGDGSDLASFMLHEPI